MTLGSVDIEGISLPIPVGWKKSASSESYLGEEGLLDPRIAHLKGPEDLERLRAELQRFGGIAETILLLGRPCLRASYRRPGATVRTYSIPLGDDREVRAVYVFRDGYEAVLDAVVAAFEGE